MALDGYVLVVKSHPVLMRNGIISRRVRGRARGARPQARGASRESGTLIGLLTTLDSVALMPLIVNYLLHNESSNF